MLAAKRLPELLRSILHDGIDGACLMTAEGSLLASAFVDDSLTNETKLAAISSSIWNCQSDGPEMRLQIIKLEEGHLAVASAGRGYLIAAVGSTATMGMLKSQILHLSDYFSGVFAQIK